MCQELEEQLQHLQRQVEEVKQRAANLGICGILWRGKMRRYPCLSQCLRLLFHELGTTAGKGVVSLVFLSDSQMSCLALKTKEEHPGCGN